MPGEFEPHAACWMAYPHRRDNWRLAAAPAQRAYANVAKTIAQFEPVNMCVPAEHMAHAHALMDAPSLHGHLRLIEMPNDDAWLRDQAPTFVINDGGNVRGVDWTFNAWGGLYPLTHDDANAARICKSANALRYRCPMVLEGGAIHTDGQGTLITTEECLLNPNRNPNMTRAQIEQTLREYLGVTKIIWLGAGVVGDEDTSGHVDNLCCFVRPHVVLLHWTDDEHDPQYARSVDAYERLSRETDAHGRRFEIHKLRAPAPMYFRESDLSGLERSADGYTRQVGARMAASYVNFYIANGAVVMPSFDDAHDEPARRDVQALFPDRTVVSVFSREVLLGGGNIHCITQQQPAPRRMRD